MAGFYRRDFAPTTAQVTHSACVRSFDEGQGYYGDASGYHGFLRASDGTLTTIDPPGSNYNIPAAINPEGAITGYYVDANFVSHGFLREKAM